MVTTAFVEEGVVFWRAFCRHRRAARKSREMEAEGVVLCDVEIKVQSSTSAHDLFVVCWLAADFTSLHRHNPHFTEEPDIQRVPLIVTRRRYV
jgi:hypothetical protein